MTTTTPENRADMSIENIVEVFDNGELVGFGSVESDNTWDFTLNELSTGLHTMTARSGGITSDPKIIKVVDSSGCENWSSFTPGQDLVSGIPYTSGSGLIISCTHHVIIERRSWIHDIQGTLHLTLRGDMGFSLACIFPAPITQMTLNITPPIENISPTSNRTEFITETNKIIPHKSEFEAGEQVFNLDEPVKAVYFYRRGHPSVDLRIREIAWRS